MSVSNMLLCGADMLSVIFAIYLFFSYFDIFFNRKQGKSRLICGLTGFAIWQCTIMNINIFQVYVNIAITIAMVLLAVVVIYEGKFWSKCIFAIAFNAIWMLTENLCRYLLLIYCEQYAEIQLVGSLFSKLCFLVVIKALKKVFTDDDIRELPVKYSIMLVLIPTGSIYIMDNIFMLGYEIKSIRTNLNSAVAVVILLGINILIFHIYMKLAEDLQLRRVTSVYEQQLELCERHQQEREISMLQLRDARHNMKNSLVSILAYAEQGECEKISRFVNEIMESSGVVTSAIANSGNIVTDSLIGYWCVVAEKEGINFTADLNIPMKMPFKGADICLILGNLLENAVEAARKVDGKKYIRVQMKYDKNNLLLFVTNSYKGRLVKTRYKELKSTKPNAENHGVGLPSVSRVATKYQGTVVIDDSVPERFLIRVVLYGNVK